MIRAEAQYILVGYKVVNGFIRDFKVIEYHDCKERLEYLMTCSQCKELKEKGYIIDIYGKEE